MTCYDNVHNNSVSSQKTQIQQHLMSNTHLLSFISTTLNLNLTATSPTMILLSINFPHSPKRLPHLLQNRQIYFSFTYKFQNLPTQCITQPIAHLYPFSDSWCLRFSFLTLSTLQMTILSL